MMLSDFDCVFCFRLFSLNLRLWFQNFFIMSLTPEELEFFAQEEEVEVMPTSEIPTMWLITGDVGPFEVGMPIKIPLWIALQLRADNKCNIIAPSWMTLSSMEKVKEIEAKTALFSKMPSNHYMTVAKLLFELCPQDIPDADAVKLLIKVFALLHKHKFK